MICIKRSNNARNLSLYTKIILIMNVEMYKVQLKLSFVTQILIVLDNDDMLNDEIELIRVINF